MEQQIRYDTVGVRASVTDEGFIRDSPVLTRSGIFEYKQPDGTVRKEYRPPEEVFAEDSLSRYKGLPVTWKHHSYITNETSKYKIIGSVLSEGRQDGDNVEAEVVLYNTDCIESGDKELSLGYRLDLEKKSGVTDDGEKYDVIQRNIIPNHLAVVSKGRAGNARFNMDSIDEDVHVMGKEKQEQPQAQKQPEVDTTALDAVKAENERLQIRLDEQKEEFEEQLAEIKRASDVKSGCERVGVEFNEDNVDKSMAAVVDKVFGEGTIRLDGLDVDSVYKASLDVFKARKQTSKENAKAMTQEFNEDAEDNLTAAERARNKYILGQGE